MSDVIFHNLVFKILLFGIFYEFEFLIQDDNLGNWWQIIYFKFYGKYKNNIYLLILLGR